MSHLHFHIKPVFCEKCDVMLISLLSLYKLVKIKPRKSLLYMKLLRNLKCKSILPKQKKTIINRPEGFHVLGQFFQIVRPINFHQLQYRRNERPALSLVVLETTNTTNTHQILRNLLQSIRPCHFQLTEQFHLSLQNFFIYLFLIKK